MRAIRINFHVGAEFPRRKSIFKISIELQKFSSLSIEARAADGCISTFCVWGICIMITIGLYRRGAKAFNCCGKQFTLMLPTHVAEGKWKFRALMHRTLSVVQYVNRWAILPADSMYKANLSWIAACSQSINHALKTAVRGHFSFKFVFKRRCWHLESFESRWISKNKHGSD